MTIEPLRPARTLRRPARSSGSRTPGCSPAGPVRRRHRAAGHAARRVRPQPVRARADRVDRLTRGAPALDGVVAVVHRRRTWTDSPPLGRRRSIGRSRAAPRRLPGRRQVRLRRRSRRGRRRADRRYLAEDGRELVDIEYDPLPAVTRRRRGLTPNPRSSTRRWAPTTSATLAGGRRRRRRGLRRRGPRVRRRFHSGRVDRSSPSSAAASSPSYEDRGGGSYVLHASTQMPHLLRMLAAPVLGVPRAGCRSRRPTSAAPSGSSASIFPEDIVVPAVAAPVRPPGEVDRGPLGEPGCRGPLQGHDLHDGDRSDLRRHDDRLPRALRDRQRGLTVGAVHAAGRLPGGRDATCPAATTSTPSASRSTTR